MHAFARSAIARSTRPRSNLAVTLLALALDTSLAGLSVLWAAPEFHDGSERVSSGLVALYDFRSEGGDRVRDLSGFKEPADLEISSAETVRWAQDALAIQSPARIRSTDRLAKISDLVRISGEITVEAWIEPLGDRSAGSACILAMSNGTDQRNFELSQDGEFILARFRTSRTGRADPPQLSALANRGGSGPAQVVFTRDRSGRARIFLDGKLAREQMVEGGVLDWEKTNLTLANDSRRGRPWLGTIHLLAIYARDLAPTEVARNFEVGPSAGRAVARESVVAESFFESEIGPLLARRCLDCHDSAVRQGGLDLSRRESALGGGDHGPAIVPGAATKSLVWTMVMADSMPQNRAPLSDLEKRVLREWIDGGAEWPDGPLEAVGFAEKGSSGTGWIRRLTASEYLETIRSLTGLDLSDDARGLLPPDLRADGFNNTAYNLTVDLGHVEAYARLARKAAAHADVRELAGPGLAFGVKQIRNMGRRVLRGPVEGIEIELYLTLAESVSELGGTFEEAARHVLEAMLQSPRFLYRVEQQLGDGTAWPADPYELASRLGYIVWGAPPDSALLDAAESGDLSDSAEVRHQVQRMLEDPRAVARSKEFISQWLDMDRLANLNPNREMFPSWDAQLAADMRSETLAFFEDLVWRQNRPLHDLFNAQFTYLTPRLAAHYGLEPEGPGLRRYDLATKPGRGGLLTQGTVLTVGGDDASMVTRGLFLLEDLLSGEVGSPPPGLDTSPVPPTPGRSRRAIAMDRVRSPACGGCHRRFEPLAFGLEKFNGVGSYSEVDEHGNVLREDGEIVLPGSDGPVSFASLTEMLDLLARSDDLQRTIIRKLAQFAIGRPLGTADEAAVEEIHRQVGSRGATYGRLVSAIVTSDLVRSVQTEH